MPKKKYADESDRKTGQRPKQSPDKEKDSAEPSGGLKRKRGLAKDESEDPHYPEDPKERRSFERS